MTRSYQSLLSAQMSITAGSTGAKHAPTIKEAHLHIIVIITHPLPMLLALGLAFVPCNSGTYWCQEAGNCVTVDQCERDYKHIVYRLLQECSKAYAFDQSGLFRRGDDGTYACQNETYTVIEGNTVRCVKELEDCGRMYMAKDKKACVDLPERCLIFSWSKAYSSADTNECISDQECFNRDCFLYS